MLRRYELTDQEWEQIAPLLPAQNTGKPGRPPKDNRLMLNAMVLGRAYTAVSVNGLMMEFWITFFES